MEPVVVLQWEYLPVGFFEEPIYGKFDQTDLKIENGKVEASTPASAYDASPGVGDSLYDRVEGYFRATQVLAHRPLKLSAPVTIRIDEKGNRLSEVHRVDGLEMRSGQGTVEPLSTDASGNVLADAKRDRLAREQRFRDLVVKHVADETLQVMLRGYGAAIGDPADEFIHLYEIRDALKRRFHGEKRALMALRNATTETSWNDLGNLANGEPVRQGRHRGTKGLSLRNATEQELATARAAAVHLIHAYLSYLDRP